MYWFTSRCHYHDISNWFMVYWVCQIVMAKTLSGYDVLVYVKVSLPRHLKLVYGLLVYVKLS